MMGMQIYSRAADGKPVFEEFSWRDRCVSRFAGDNLPGHDNIDALTRFITPEEPQ
jgi:hypothetical protein